MPRSGLMGRIARLGSSTASRSDKQALTQLRDFAKKGNLTACSEHFEKMLKKGYRPDTYVYDQLLLACARSGGKWRTAFKFYNQMKKRAITPSTYSMSHLVTCAEATDSSKCTERIKWIREEMIRKGIEPSTETCNNMIRALISSKAISEARSFFRNMPAAPDVATFTLILSSHMEPSEKNIRAAFALWEEMRAVDITPDSRFACNLLKICNINSEPRLALETASELRLCRVDLDERALTILMASYGAIGHCWVANDMLQEAVSNKNVHADVVFFNTLLHLATKRKWKRRAKTADQFSSDKEAVPIILEGMASLKIAPDAGTLGLLIRHNIMYNNVEETYELVRECLSKRFKLVHEEVDALERFLQHNAPDNPTIERLRPLVETLRASARRKWEGK